MDRPETEQLDPATVPDEDIAGIQQVLAAAAAADGSDDPVPTVEVLGERIRSSARPDERRLIFLARCGGRVAGRLLLVLPLNGNPHLAMFHLVVDPRCRRQGLGTALLRAGVPALVADGRRTVLAQAYEGPGAEFSRACGLEPAQVLRTSRLVLAEVDRADLESIAAADHPGYRTRAWTGHCPDDLLDGYVRAKDAMRDMPMGDVDFAGRDVSATVIRADEEEQRQRRQDFRVVVAVHEASGDVAGLTEVVVPRVPRVSLIGDTAVVPAHRGHGLGLWLKARMTLQLMAERADVEEIRTGNASDNAYMLAINQRLGYRPDRDLIHWQGDVATLAAGLG